MSATAADPPVGTRAAPTLVWVWVLQRARDQWQATRGGLDALHPTEQERAVLTPLLRRAAVVKACAPNFGSYLGFYGYLLAAGLLAVGIPILVTLLIDGSVEGGRLAAVSLYYLLCLLAILVVAFPVFGLLDWLMADRSRRIRGLTTLVAVSAGTAGITAFWLSLDAASSSLALALFSAVMVVLGAALVAVVDLAVGAALNRRRHSVQGIDHTAALLLYEEWAILAARRRDWRTSTQRRKLPKALASLASSTQFRLEQSLLTNGGNATDASWLADLVWQLRRSILDDRTRLLRIDSHRQYRDLMEGVRKRTVALCAGDWSALDRPGEVARASWWYRRIAPLGVPVVLAGAAAGIGFVPGLDISPDTLFTVRLSLVVPAVLSLLSVNHGSRDILLSAMRDTVGLIKR